MINPITCLEITSSSIKLLVGYLFEKEVYVLQALESSRTHLNNFKIEDKNEMKEGILELIQEVKKSLNIEIEDIVLGFSSVNYVYRKVEALTTLTSSDNIVSEIDGINLISMAKKTCYEYLNRYSIVDILPIKYVVDNIKESYKFPIGLNANDIRLEGIANLIDKTYFEEIVNCVKSTNLNIVNTVCIANSSNVFLYDMLSKYSPNQMKSFIYINVDQKDSLFCNCSKDDYISSISKCYGYYDILNYVSTKLNVSKEVADFYLMTYGISNDPDFSFKTEEGYSLSEIGKVVKESLEDLFNYLSSFLSTVSNESKTFFIVSGKIIEIVGFQKYISERFSCKVSCFVPANFGSRNPSFTNLVSMLYYYGNKDLKGNGKNVSLTLTRNSLNIKKVDVNNKGKDKDLLNNKFKEETL